MMIYGVDFTEMAKPATLEVSENELGTVFRMTFRDRCYQYVLNHFELLSIPTNDLIIERITDIINNGKYRLGI